MSRRFDLTKMERKKKTAKLRGQSVNAKRRRGPRREKRMEVNGKVPRQSRVTKQVTASSRTGVAGSDGQKKACMCANFSVSHHFLIISYYLLPFGPFLFPSAIGIAVVELRYACGIPLRPSVCHASAGDDLNDFMHVSISSTINHRPSQSQAQAECGGNSECAD